MITPSLQNLQPFSKQQPKISLNTPQHLPPLKWELRRLLVPAAPAELNEHKPSSLLHTNTGLGVLTPTKACPKLAVDPLQAAAVGNKAPDSMDQLGYRGCGWKGGCRVSTARAPQHTQGSLCPSRQGQAALTVTQLNPRGDPGVQLPEHTGDHSWALWLQCKGGGGPRVTEVQQHSLQGSFPSFPTAQCSASPRHSDPAQNLRQPQRALISSLESRFSYGLAAQGNAGND